MLKNSRKNLGNIGETIAANFLERKGYKIIKRNFLCHNGEIDIIAKKYDEYVFCEVKTRRNTKYGNPIDSVNFVKQKHLLEATKYYLYINNLYCSNLRFDIIEIYLSNKCKYINHIKNVNFEE